MSNMEIGLFIALAGSWIVVGLLIKIAMTKAGDALREAESAKYHADRANERAWGAWHDVQRLAKAAGFKERKTEAKVEWVEE